MPSTFALLSSDPSLLRCQVEILKARLRPIDALQPRVVGLGYIEADSILLRKKPADVGSLALSTLVADVISEVLFFQAGSGGRGPYADEDAMPLRYRRWMFMQHGELASPGPTRAAVLQQVPDFLQRQLKGTTPAEVCFLAFMKALRDEGRSEDFDISPSLVGRLLGEMTRRVERAELESGKLGSLGFFVTDGRVLAATRLNSGQLFYALLEGITHCERCGISESTPDSNPLLRAHRRVRGVALATDVVNASGFIEVPEAAVLTVGHKLEVQVASLPTVAA